MLLNPNLSLTDLAGIAIALVIGVTCHEFSHAFTADRWATIGRVRWAGSRSTRSGTSIRSAPCSS